MLTHLAIRDFAVVRAAELDFGPGLTVISGETGAGKSLLVDALGFLSGQRADSSVVRHGAERAELVALFDLADAPAARAWLREQDMLDEGPLDEGPLDEGPLDEGALDERASDHGDQDPGECQLRRTLRADGGSRSWINGRPATLGQVAELAGHLVEIHGQHAHQALLSKPSQLALLDAYGRHDAELAAVAEAARAWSALEREREALSRQGDVAERIGWLEHQLDELARESLAPDSIAELVAGHRRHAHAAELIAACDAGFAQLGGDDAPSLARQLQQVRATLARQRDHEPRLAEVDAMLDAAAIQLDEATALLDRVRADLDLDPATYDEMDRRLARLHDLGRKHRVPVEALAAHHDALAAELDALRGAGERLQRLEREIASAAAHWRGSAAALTAARDRAATALADATTVLIGELGMGGGRFGIDLEPQAVDRPDPLGAERIEFMVAANPGQPPRPLRKVASGGELSRISLAIEVAALGLDAVPTMVFDEVDSGIGGAVADIVGRKLRELSAKRQVLCVTHLPQVAAQGHAHYRVSKAASEGVTRSAVQALDQKERAEELARMLGGVDVSREARAAAKRLLADVG